MDATILFRESLAADEPPDMAPAAQGLWWLAKGDWDRAHQIAQDHEGDAACDWLHAHLHRAEGDAFNARYWYGRANIPVPSVDLSGEFDALLRAVLPAAE